MRVFLEGKLRDILGKMEGHTQKRQRVAKSKESVGERMLLFVLHLEPDNDGGRITENVGVGRERTLQS